MNADAFLKQSLERWKADKIFHYTHEFLSHVEQERYVLRELADHSKRHGKTTISMDFSDLPEEVDVFLTLLSLQRPGAFRLQPPNRWTGSDAEVPRVFQIELLGEISEQKEIETEKESVTLFVFDKADELLYFQGKPRVFAPKSMEFIGTCFDLCENIETGVEVDEILAGTEANWGGMSKKNEEKTKKKEIYDRVALVNKQILKQTGVERFFHVRNQRVFFSHPEAITVREKTKVGKKSTPLGE
jgi:hypothetical protein